jgi:hypothetical protein
VSAEACTWLQSLASVREMKSERSQALAEACTWLQSRASVREMKSERSPALAVAKKAFPQGFLYVN